MVFKTMKTILFKNKKYYFESFTKFFTFSPIRFQTYSLCNYRKT